MRDRVRARLRSLLGVTLLGLLFGRKCRCALLCNFLFEAATFGPKFVCLFFHDKFLTILASIVGYEIHQSFVVVLLLVHDKTGKSPTCKMQLEPSQHTRGCQVKALTGGKAQSEKSSIGLCAKLSSSIGLPTLSGSSKPARPASAARTSWIYPAASSALSVRVV